MVLYHPFNGRMSINRKCLLWKPLSPNEDLLGPDFRTFDRMYSVRSFGLQRDMFGSAFGLVVGYTRFGLSDC